MSPDKLSKSAASGAFFEHKLQNTLGVPANRLWNTIVKQMTGMVLTGEGWAFLVELF
ncbi:hypothetical protein CHCC20375_3020 [Bacillus licheniformis]|nr:hypothetical protein CHCC20375_3020 [Bacillus licheniformis]